MLKHIHVTDLKPGMWVVIPEGAGQARQHLYASERFIDSESTVRQILAQGYKEVYIDLALSESRYAKRYSQATAQVLEGSAPVARAVQHVPPKHSGRPVALQDELPQAARLYGKAVHCVRQLMSSAILGVLNTGMAADVVDSLVGSLERNPDALLCLSSMRQWGPYAYTHCTNVAILLAAFALSNGNDRQTAMDYGLGGLLHDMGKAMLPVSLLNARRKLNENEQKLIRLHPLLAYEFLSSSPEVCPEVRKAALEHHERYDGSGYPRGLSGGDISEIGQLSGIADTYDALTSRRPFKEAVNPHKSLALMYNMRQREFHPLLLEKFVRLVGIYPVGSVVALKDGHKGVVSAGNPANPMKPSVILVLDPHGKAMRTHEFDLAHDEIADIAHYIPAELSGIDPCLALGLETA